jgi:hypothetical protein
VSKHKTLFQLFHHYRFLQYSNRRAAGWVPTQNTLTGKVLIGITSTVLIGGILAAVIVPFVVATSETESANADVI